MIFAHSPSCSSPVVRFKDPADCFGRKSAVRFLIVIFKFRSTFTPHPTAKILSDRFRNEAHILCLLSNGFPYNEGRRGRQPYYFDSATFSASFIGYRVPGFRMGMQRRGALLIWRFWGHAENGETGAGLYGDLVVGDGCRLGHLVDRESGTV
jgi:hypothetical protein